VKNLFFCLFLFCACVCFSQARYGDIELFTGMPFVYESLDGGNETLKTEAPPLSMGIGAVNYNAFGNPSLGIVFIVNFIYPKAFLYDINGEESRYDRKDLMAFDFQYGAGYRLFETGVFKFPVSLGLHLFFMSGTSNALPTTSRELVKFGLGIGASAAAEFHVNSAVYFFARLQGSFDFFTFTKWKKYTGVSVGPKMAYYIDSDEYGGLSLHAGLTPTIGIGLKLDGFVRQGRAD
jgi:hypothetical protein